MSGLQKNSLYVPYIYTWTTVSTEIRRWANKERPTCLGIYCRPPPVQTIPQRPRHEAGTICTGPQSEASTCTHWPSYRPCYDVTLNRHLAVTKIRTDPICSACSEEDETSVHFLGKCPATIMTRHSTLGSYFLRSAEVCCIQPHALMRFVRASKRFK